MHRSIPSVVVLGDGLLGSEIVKQTNWDYISRKKDKFDITQYKTFNNFFIENFHGVAFTRKYDVIVNCIANTKTYSEDNNLIKSVNYDSVINLTNYCKEHNIKLIQISSDYVYANSNSFAKETDLPLISPNWYTYYKVLTDEYISNKLTNFLICRCSFKPNPFPYQSAWIDQIGNFDYVDVIADLIIRLINNNSIGIYNVGTELKTIYDLAKQTHSTVLPSMAPEFVPKNITMDLTQMKNALKRIN